MANFVNDNTTINNYYMEIRRCLSKLTALQKTYSDSVSTANNHISSISFDTWQDDVQAAFTTRKEQLTAEMRQIENSVNSEHLPALISKLEDLRYKLEELRNENLNYNKLYQIDKKLKDYKAENGSIDGFADTIKSYSYNFTTETSFKSAYNRSRNRRNELVDEINAIINYISGITFGEALPSEEEINSAASSGSESGVTTTLSQFSNGVGVYNIHTTTGEENGMYVIERTITLSNDATQEGAVPCTSYRIERDPNDPAVGTITYQDDRGHSKVYEYFRNEDGELMVRFKDLYDDEFGRARPAEITNGVVTITRPDGTVVQENINSSSELDKGELYFKMESERMTEYLTWSSDDQLRYSNAYADFANGNHTYSISDVWGGSETTVSFEMTWD